MPETSNTSSSSDQSATLDVLNLPDGRFMLVLSGPEDLILELSPGSDFDRLDVIAERVGAAACLVLPFPTTVLGPEPVPPLLRARWVVGDTEPERASAT